MPTAVAEQSLLDRNLACLGDRNEDTIRALRDGPAAPVRFERAADGAWTATVQEGGVSRRLASRHRPIEEAERIADRIDIVNHAVIVALGFGLGHHVRRLAERIGRTGVILIYEPDLALLRAVFEKIDCSSWLRDALVLFIHDANDRAVLSRKLAGAEAIVAQGVAFVDHPASRSRLGEGAAALTTSMREFMVATKTTLVTTLVRSTDTIRNILWNIDHYALGSGVADLKNAAAGCPAIVVSAGPSLQRNIQRLAEPGVRDRCIIIAVQTTLRPLLEAGVKPHFVTALDYHEISKRFYEGLTREDVDGVTLVAEPKAHPVIIDSFPGPVRCTGNAFADELLGPAAREMGALPAGATVAHLAFYLARHLGCDPIAFIGQDLAFTDGLYYAHGTAIHDVWAPELNPFNTIEMMEWQRIVRHRLHLHTVEDHHGRRIFTDSQMLTYLQQFERDFAAAVEAGTTVIDATEGGVRKQHTTALPLRAVLDRYATRAAPDLPAPASDDDAARRRAVHERLAFVRQRLVQLRQASLTTKRILEEMLQSQHDRPAMDRLFDRLDAQRKKVDSIFDTFELLNHLNQLGAFRRQRSDRRLQLSEGLSEIERQHAQLERDLDNVIWIADAAEEMAEMLADAMRLLESERSVWRRTPPSRLVDDDDGSPRELKVEARVKAAALVAIDPERNGLGLVRSLGEEFRGRSVLQATLERLGRSRQIDEIVLLAPGDFDVERLIDRGRIARHVEIERFEGSPFGPEREAIAAARLWADTCWRGGIAGASIYDEALCPRAMHEVMERRSLTAAIIAAPDWPLLDPGDSTGVDAIVGRHREHPDRHNLVFTQAPPGLCGCLVSRSLMAELSIGNRLSMLGALLIYQPHAPQADPIARDACVQIDHDVRRSLMRATFDSPRRIAHLRRALSRIRDDASKAEVIAALESTADPLDLGPEHLIVEPLSLDVAQRLFESLSGDTDLRVTFRGSADDDFLLHPHFDRLIAMAKEAGAAAVHVRTSLRCERSTLDRLLASPVDVVSVDLNADRAATYEAMMGEDRFRDVLLNLEHLVENRRRLTAHPGAAAFALPWIVPRLTRCPATLEDINSFFDRWMAVLGCAVIEGEPPLDSTLRAREGEFTTVLPPRSVVKRELLRRMTIRSDGSVPVTELDSPAGPSLGNVTETSIDQLWPRLVDARRTIFSTEPDGERARTAWP